MMIEEASSQQEQFQANNRRGVGCARGEGVRARDGDTQSWRGAGNSYRGG